MTHLRPDMIMTAASHCNIYSLVKLIQHNNTALTALTPRSKFRHERFFTILACSTKQMTKKLLVRSHEEFTINTFEINHHKHFL
jgi:hypothetical protein